MATSFGKVWSISTASTLFRLPQGGQARVETTNWTPLASEICKRATLLSRGLHASDEAYWDC